MFYQDRTVDALIVVVSALFESLGPEERRKAALLIEDAADLVRDPVGRGLLATFNAEAHALAKPANAKVKRRK
jgi:hypothetical protein